MKPFKQRCYCQSSYLTLRGAFAKNILTSRSIKLLFWSFRSCRMTLISKCEDEKDISESGGQTPPADEDHTI